MGLLLIGDFYGHNAHWRTNREAEDRAKNAVLTDLAEREDTAGEIEDANHAAADREAAELLAGLPHYPLTPAMASALNVVRE